MKYPKGTFFKNLQAATKFGDDEMVLDLIADQTTDIAMSHPEALSAALQNAGVKVDKENTDSKYLVGLIADSIYTNPKLVQNLSLMISDINTPNASEGDTEASATDSKGNGKMSGEAKAGMVGSIVTGVTSIFGGVVNLVQGDKIKKQEVKQKMFDYMQAKENAKAAIAQAAATGKAEVAKHKTIVTFGLAVIVIGGIAAAFYFLNKPTATTSTVGNIAP